MKPDETQVASDTINGENFKALSCECANELINKL